MRRVGWVVVLLGLAAFGFVMFEAGLTPFSGPPDRDTSPDHAVAVRWLIAWAAVVGCAAVAILIRGLGDLVMKGRTRMRLTDRRPSTGHD